MKLMTKTEYAMYKGDKFIDLGTIAYLANKYHKTEKLIKYLTLPSVHKKATATCYLFTRSNKENKNEDQD